MILIVKYSPNPDGETVKLLLLRAFPDQAKIPALSDLVPYWGSAQKKFH
jgi:hypothetical protein